VVPAYVDPPSSAKGGRSQLQLSSKRLASSGMFFSSIQRLHTDNAASALVVIQTDILHFSKWECQDTQHEDVKVKNITYIATLVSPFIFTHALQQQVTWILNYLSFNLAFRLMSALTMDFHIRATTTTWSSGFWSMNRRGSQEPCSDGGTSEYSLEIILCFYIVADT
jgi:hypothetical protein